MNWTDKELEEIEDVFATPGWGHIIHDIEETYQNRNTLLNIQSTEEFWQVRGEISQLQWFTNLAAWYEYIKENA